MNTAEILQAKDLRIQVLEEQLTACKSDRKRLKKQLKLYGVSNSLPNVYEGKNNSARIKFYKHLAKTMNVSEYATRHIFNEACDWYKTLT